MDGQPAKNIGNAHRVTDFRQDISKKVHELLSEKKKYDEYMYELEELKKKLLEQKLQRSKDNMLRKLSAKVTDLRQIDLVQDGSISIKELRKEQAQQRRETIRVEDQKKNVIWALKGHLVQEYRRQMTQEAIVLGMQRRNNMKMLKVIKLSTVIQAMHRNF